MNAEAIMMLLKLVPRTAAVRRANDGVIEIRNIRMMIRTRFGVEYKVKRLYDVANGVLYGEIDVKEPARMEEIVIALDAIESARMALMQPECGDSFQLYWNKDKIYLG